MRRRKLTRSTRYCRGKYYSHTQTFLFTHPRRPRGRKMIAREMSKVGAAWRGVAHRRLTELFVASVILRAGPKKVFLMIRNLFSGGGGGKGGDIVALAQVESERDERKGKAVGRLLARANNAALCGNREDSNNGKRRKERKKERMSDVSVAWLVSGLKKVKKWICRRHQKREQSREKNCSRRGTSFSRIISFPGAAKPSLRRRRRPLLNH